MYGLGKGLRRGVMERDADVGVRRGQELRKWVPCSWFLDAKGVELHQHKWEARVNSECFGLLDTY